MRILPWEEDAADYYAEIRHQLLNLGSQSVNWTSHRAHALAACAVLFTENMRHYERIVQPLSLENWKQLQTTKSCGTSPRTTAPKPEPPPPTASAP